MSSEATDGKRYKQLVKQGDDTRQDAVMQQVFDFVNHILSCDDDTRKRHLQIRTYKIVPITPLCGLIEWVDNTIQFGHYLSERDVGAHARYRPDDWTHIACREHLKNASTKDPQDRFNRLTTIYDNFKPCMKYFFLEAFADPSSWVQRRIAYTRSVATSSMIGYILGIGDRHTQNILIDTSTAEVIHIDFGIVFDQGKNLGMPETVPFRLTRDVVDGMGVCNADGPFRKCCEEVLRVLRANTLQLLTILKVVIHDPLYKWSLSPQDVRNRQQLLGATGAGDSNHSHNQNNNMSKINIKDKNKFIFRF